MAGDIGPDGPIGPKGEKGEYGEFGAVGEKGDRVSIIFICNSFLERNCFRLQLKIWKKKLYKEFTRSLRYFESSWLWRSCTFWGFLSAYHRRFPHFQLFV